jgi:hypothetical protein
MTNDRTCEETIELDPSDGDPIIPRCNWWPIVDQITSANERKVKRHP